MSPKKLVDTGIKLVGTKVCPFVERIRLTLSYKSLAVDYHNMSPLEQKSEEFTKISPYKRVPVIVLEDGKSIYESAAIFQYIDEEFPEKKLLIGTSYEKAQQRIWTHFCNTKLSTSLYKLMFEQEQQAEFEKDLIFLESYMKQNSGKYFHGDNVTMSDLMFLPFFYRFSLLKKFSNYDFDKAKFPTMSKVLENLKKEEWFKPGDNVAKLEEIENLYQPYATHAKKNPYTTYWRFY